MNSISTRTILFSCLLMGGSVWAMNSQNNQQGSQAGRRGFPIPPQWGRSAPHAPHQTQTNHHIQMRSVSAMNPQDNQQGNQEQVAPGRYGQEECSICLTDFREFAQGQRAITFLCGHWVCTTCPRVDRCPLCREPAREALLAEIRTRANTNPVNQADRRGYDIRNIPPQWKYLFRGAHTHAHHHNGQHD